MSEMKSTLVSRRTVTRTAAWSAPVVAAAIAAPLASASTGTADVMWSSSSAQLASLQLANGGQLADLSLLPSGPNSFSVVNTAGAIVGPITGNITVEFSGGVSVSLGRLKGFEPESIDGATITNVSEYNTGFLVNASVGSSTDFVIPGGIPSGATQTFTVNWGVTESGGSLLSISAFANYTATLTLFDGTGTLIDQAELGTIRSLVGAAIFG